MPTSQYDIEKEYDTGDVGNNIGVESGRTPVVVGLENSDFETNTDALEFFNNLDNISRTIAWPYGQLFDKAQMMVIDDEAAAPGGASDTGWKSPTSSHDPATIDNWVNGNNGFAADDSYASTSIIAKAEATADIYYQDFGITIPAGKEIYGIEVAIDCYWSGDGVWPGQNSVSLSWNGSSETSRYFLLTDWPEDVEGTITIGGGSNTWGRTWSPSEFADGLFEVRIFVKAPYPWLSGNSTAFYIDWVRVKVYYET